MPKQLFSPLQRLFSLPERRQVPVVIQMSQRIGPARIPDRAPLPFPNARPPVPCITGMDTAARASAAGLGCIRGTSFALLFEAVAALLVYGICHLWHLFR